MTTSTSGTRTARPRSCWGSRINHASEPNAFLWLVPDDTSAELWSVRPIAAGEEVTVSYRAEGPDSPLWFEVEDPV